MSSRFLLFREISVISDQNSSMSLSCPKNTKKKQKNSTFNSVSQGFLKKKTMISEVRLKKSTLTVKIWPKLKTEQPSLKTRLKD